MAKTKAQKALAAFARARRDTVLVTEDHRVDKSLAARIQRREEVLKEVLKAMSPKRRNKHGNNVSYDTEGKWDSDAEKRRWGKLKLLQKAGKIFDLRRQLPIWLHAAPREPYGDGKAVGKYVADFVYLTTPGSIELVDWRDGTVVVEDVKGHCTNLYKWKRTHFKAEYGFAIKEVKA